MVRIKCLVCCTSGTDIAVKQTRLATYVDGFHFSSHHDWAPSFGRIALVAFFMGPVFIYFFFKFQIFCFHIYGSGVRVSFRFKV